jgi:O-glycosyl hydrolase
MIARANQPRLIQEVGGILKERGLTRTSVSAADANSVAEMVGNADAYDSLTLSYISQFNSHSYSGSDADRRSLAGIARTKRKKLWQSETGPSNWPGGDQFDVAMWSAGLILRDLREMRAEAWLDWQVAGGGIWGVIDYTVSNQTSKMNKKGYAYSQFSRFIRPGSTIIASDNANTLAALVPATGSLVLVAVNAGTTPVAYAFDLGKFQSLPQAAQVYRTSATQNLVSLAEIPVQSKSIALEAPALSVTTLVLKGSVPTSVSLAPSRPGNGTLGRFGLASGQAYPVPMYWVPEQAFPINPLGQRRGYPRVNP